MSVQEALGWALIHSIWEGAIIAGVLGVVLLSIRSSRIRYAAACVALLAMLATFVVTFIHFVPERGSGAGTLARIALPPWDARQLAGGTIDRFPRFDMLIPRLAPIWILGVCLFICAMRWDGCRSIECDSTAFGMHRITGNAALHGWLLS
jgi:bla regulator protein blaR1